MKIIANAVNYEKAIEDNNELRAKVNYQQDQIKHLQKKDIEDEDEVQEITSARIP